MNSLVLEEKIMDLFHYSNGIEYKLKYSVWV